METKKPNEADWDKASGPVAPDSRIVVIDDLRQVKWDSPVVRVGGFVCALCLKGHGSCYVDERQYEVAAGDLFVCRPDAILENGAQSEDSEFRCVCFSLEYLKELSRYFIPAWDALLFLEQNPVLHLRKEESVLFCQYYDLLRSKLSGAGASVHSQKIIDTLLQIFLHELYGMLQQRGAFAPTAYSSAESLFKNFINLLISTSLKKRSVSYYAARLYVTPKYLSAVCKSVSGCTASALIHRHVCKDIQYMLMRRDKSIKEIANELDFPNLSFFGKYVRQHLGVSPRNFRRELREK